MKRPTKSIHRICGLFLALAMVFTASGSVFASKPEKHSDQATITVGKELTTKEEGTFPDVESFEFLLSPYQYTPGPTSAEATKFAKDNIPNIGGTTGPQVITVDGFSKDAPGTSQKKTVKSAPITYTQAGVYTYFLQERIPGQTDNMGTPEGEPVRGVWYDYTEYYD